MYGKKDEIDADKVCQFYNGKYGIDIKYYPTHQTDTEEHDDDVGYIFTAGAHHYGAVFVTTDNGEKYCIIADTMSRGHPMADKIARKENRKVIYIGEGLQNDGENCAIFALEMVKTLLKDKCRIAKSLIDFYSKNKEFGRKNICHDDAAAYRAWKKHPKENKTYTTLEQMINESKKGMAESVHMTGVLSREYPNVIFEGIIKKELKDEDLKDGETLLYDVPNEKFFDWEYAGEFLKLAQSLNLQSKVGNKKVGKNEIELKNYANFYSSFGKNVEGIAEQYKEKLKDKKVSTKIYCKKEKYKNLMQNDGKLDKDNYQKKIKPMINFDAKGCDKLHQKYQKIK